MMWRQGRGIALSSDDLLFCVCIGLGLSASGPGREWSAQNRMRKCRWCLPTRGDPRVSVEFGEKASLRECHKRSVAHKGHRSRCLCLASSCIFCFLTVWRRRRPRIQRWNLVGCLSHVGCGIGRLCPLQNPKGALLLKMLAMVVLVIWV